MERKGVKPVTFNRVEGRRSLSRQRPSSRASGVTPKEEAQEGGKEAGARTQGAIEKAASKERVAVEEEAASEEEGRTSRASGGADSSARARVVPPPPMWLRDVPKRQRDPRERADVIAEVRGKNERDVKLVDLNDPRAAVEGVNNRLFNQVALINLGGRRSSSASLDKLVASVADFPAHVIVCLEAWGELIAEICKQGGWVSTDIFNGLAVLAKAPLAKEVVWLAREVHHDEARKKYSPFALAEVRWDSWTVCGEFAFRLVFGFLNPVVAKKKVDGEDMICQLGRMIVNASTYAVQVMPRASGADTAFRQNYSLHPRLLCVDANMRLFDIENVLEQVGVGGQLFVHHAEYLRTQSCDASKPFLLASWRRPDFNILYDSMGMFAVGPFEGFNSKGWAAKAKRGACWPQEKTTGCRVVGSPNRSYQGRGPPQHIAEALDI